MKWRNVQENIRIQKMQSNREIESMTLEGTLKFVNM